MVSIDKEPTIRVGLMASDAPVRVDLKGQFISDTGRTIDGGSYRIEPHADGLRLSGDHTMDSTGSLRLSPTDPIDGRFVIDGVTIGVDFHWQRKETQSFQGALKIFIAGSRLQIINEIPLELYLTSVISSEM
ncbi:MAG TPA: amidase, partial [Blastocatellia bacterium]|nr:amidase [Blastocatellia bacterium]